MRSTIIAVLAAAGLSSAAALPRQSECPGSGAYYVCANNNFRGHCSVDPCALKWCPDFYDRTCARRTVPTPGPSYPVKPNATCTTSTTVTVTPTIVVHPPRCTDGGYYQVCSNGFKGCCASDVCGSDRPYCPQKPSTPSPKICSPSCSATTTVTSTATASDYYVTPTPTCASCEGPNPPAPEVEECSGSTGAFYVCAKNGFRGQCSVDPCALSWCPDYTKDTCTPKTTPATEDKPKQEYGGSTGAYYVCASNGFRGQCSVDPCARAWCPDFKEDTYTPIAKPPVSAEDACPSGTGYYQVCSNGYRGCCKTDACAGPNPVCPSRVY